MPDEDAGYQNPYDEMTDEEVAAAYNDYVRQLFLQDDRYSSDVDRLIAGPLAYC